MEFKLLKTETDYVVIVKTKVTPEMLNLVSDKDKTLYDKDNKPVFKIDAAKHQGQAEITLRGMLIPGKSFSFTSDNANFCYENNIKNAKLTLGQIKKYAEQVEKQVLKAYKEIEDAANEIKVEELEGDGE